MQSGKNWSASTLCARMHARETIVSRSVKVTTVPLRSYKREKKEDCASTWQQKTRKGEKEREE